ncbi:MAG: DUF488 domain-containing protein [Nitrososphaeria archaeon]
MIAHKRVYEKKEEGDGLWILVERLWPRGVRREKIDVWMREVAPSNELRKWYSHRAERWEEFRKRYEEELSSNPKIAELLSIVKSRKATIVYATTDYEHSGARVLIEYLERLMSEEH